MRSFKQKFLEVSVALLHFELYLLNILDPDHRPCYFRFHVGLYSISCRIRMACCTTQGQHTRTPLDSQRITKKWMKHESPRNQTISKIHHGTRYEFISLPCKAILLQNSLNLVSILSYHMYNQRGHALW
jgi:hypothetical protein